MILIIIYKILMERKPKIVLFRGSITMNGVSKFDIAFLYQGLDPPSNE